MTNSPESPSPENGNVRGPLMLVAAETTCWACRSATTVGALAADTASQAWDEDAEPAQWIALPEPMVLGYVASVAEAQARTITERLPTLYPDVSKTAGRRYWMNHCAACGAPIGDFFTQSEPDGPFFGSWPAGGYRNATTTVLGVGSVQCDPPYVVPPEPPRRRW